MKSRIRNVVNTYLLLMLTMLLLLLAVTIRITNVYYERNAVIELESRIEKIESIFTNYMDAHQKLREMNESYLDEALSEKLIGIMHVIQSEEAQEHSKSFMNALRKEEGLRFDYVPVVMFTDFMGDTYKVEADVYDETVTYYHGTYKEEPVKIAVRYYPQENKVAVYSESIALLEAKYEYNRGRISERIYEHLNREPEFVSSMLVDNRGNVDFQSEEMHLKNLTQVQDVMTQRPLFELIKEADKGSLEYQIASEAGYKSYLARVRYSSQYEAYIVLSIERKMLVNSVGEAVTSFFGIVTLTLILITLWTFNRYRIMTKDLGLFPASEEKKGSSLL